VIQNETLCIFATILNYQKCLILFQIETQYELARKLFNKNVALAANKKTILKERSPL